MKIDYRIEPNPHRTESDEFIIIASCYSSAHPDYSCASFFNLSDTEIFIEWVDWGSLDCNVTDDFVSKFNDTLNDYSARLLINDFIDASNGD